MKSQTYRADLKLFEELGFEPFEVEGRERFFVGKHKIETYEKAIIKVFVTCYPAQLWDFEIENDTSKFTVSTGSGCLIDYWQTAILFAKGLVLLK